MHECCQRTQHNDPSLDLNTEPWIQTPLHLLEGLLKVYSRIVATVCGCAMAMGLFKNKALKMFFVYLKEIQYLDFFHHLPTTN